MKRYDVWGANSTLEVAYTAYEGAIRRVGREFDVAGSVRRVKERIRRWMERLRHMKERFDMGGGAISTLQGTIRRVRERIRPMRAISTS